MDFHGVTMKGPLIMEIMTALPTWTTDYIGRLFFVSTANNGAGYLYYGTTSGWINVSPGDHTHTGTYLGVNDKAVNADLLDGIDSTQFARLDALNTYTYASSAIQNFNYSQLYKPEMKAYAETFIDTGSGTDYTFDFTSGNNFKRILTGNSTFTFTNAPSGSKLSAFTLFLVNGASYTITWPSSVTWQYNMTPTLTANTNYLVDILTFTSINGGTRWYGNYVLSSLPL